MPNGLLNSQEPTQQPAQQSTQQEQDPSMGELQVSPEAKVLVDQAVKILYSPGEGNLENMVKMFQQHGPEGFATAMATAVLGMLERLQSENQDIPLALLSEVGTKLFEIILQDIMEGGVITDISEEQALEAQALILEGWGKTNAGKISPQELEELSQLVATIRQQAQKSAGQQPPQQEQPAQQPAPMGPQGGM